MGDGTHIDAMGGSSSARANDRLRNPALPIEVDALDAQEGQGPDAATKCCTRGYPTLALCGIDQCVGPALGAHSPTEVPFHSFRTTGP